MPKLRPVFSRMRLLLTGLLVVVILAFALGPRPTLELPLETKTWEVPDSPEGLAQAVLGPDLALGETLRDHRCATRIRWQGLPGVKTRHTLVFVHGFSACPGELFPVLDLVADKINANLLAIRLRGHGRSDDGLAESTATQWFQDLERARQIAKAMGEETIMVGMSTGATLAVLSALENPSGLSGLVL